MKRKDFLRKMRNRRFGEVQEREPERRRAVDWRTVRLELPDSDGEQSQESTPAGPVTLMATGIRLTAEHPCWVRGYRLWEAESGSRRAEFQYRPNEDGDAAPPGAETLETGAIWAPEA